MAPLIDCVFLLLIFFMVTNAMKGVPPLKVKLPASQAKDDLPKKKFNLYIDSAGRMAVDNGVIRNLGDFEKYLAANEGYIETLVIHADKDTKHGVLLDVMERAKRRNVKTIAIAVKAGEYHGGS